MRGMGRKELFKLQVTSLDGIPDLDPHTLRSHDVILISPHPVRLSRHHLSFFFLNSFYLCLPFYRTLVVYFFYRAHGFFKLYFIN